MESKHHKLVRSVRSGTISHDMKPNAAVRDQLNVCSYLNAHIDDLSWRMKHA